MKVEIEINDCRDCPFLKIGHTYSMDGFDSGNDWTCTKSGAFIERFVEWHEVNKVKIPEWRPIKNNPK